MRNALALQKWKIGLVLISGLFLQGCMDVATTGAQAIYNHHNIQKNVNDQLITMHANQSLHVKSHAFDNTNISVATLNSTVLLTGQVSTPEQKKHVSELIRKIPHVKEVYNLLTISSPASTLTSVSDSWLTAKIKAKLIAIIDLDATQIKVVSDNGVVYLMGTLTPEDAQAAVDVARETDGVTKVVKVFSYLHISKDEYV